MSYGINDRFRIFYESGAAASYMVVKAGAGEKILNFQVEMLANNPVPGTLPLDVRQKDDTLNLFYNITSKLSLAHYLKRKKLKKEEFVRVISNIVRVLLDCRFYLLDENSYLLEEDFIHINPSTLEAYLAYVPVRLDNDVTQQFKSFLIKLIMHSANIDESSNDNFLQRIINCLKSDTFSISEFDRLLNELGECGTAAGIKEDISRVKEDGRNASRPESPGCAVPPVKASKQDSTPNNTLKARSGLNPAIIAAVLQIPIIMILFFSSGFLKSLNKDATTTYGAAGLVVIAVEVLIFKRLFEKRKPSAAEAVCTPKAPVIENMSAPKPSKEKWSLTDELDVAYESMFESKKSGKAKSAEPKVKPGVVCSTETGQENLMPAAAAYSKDTAVLSQVKEKYPYLKGQKNGIAEMIFITKQNFMIGRLKDQVDHVLQNHAVGKVHAEIISRNSAYYIKDLNSVNGTFVNNIRLESNTEYEIKNNDSITLANSDFLFIVP